MFRKFKGGDTLTRILLRRLFHRLGWITSPSHLAIGKKCCTGEKEDWDWTKGWGMSLEQVEKHIKEVGWKK